MSDYYNRDYKFNPKIREMIESRMGKLYDLSYVQIENLVSNIFKGSYNKEKKYTESDKKKIISLIKETSPNRIEDEKIDNLVNFLLPNFTEDEIRNYIDFCIYKFYKPGMVYNGVRIINDGVIHLAEKSNLYELSDGFILNRYYINDILPFFNKNEEDVEYDKKTLMVSEDFFSTKEVIDLISKYKIEHSICTYINDEIFIMIANNDEAKEFMLETFKNIRMQKVLDFKFFEKQVVEDEGDEMQLAPGIVMKGNFKKIGKIGGTEIIGVGASNDENSPLDKIYQETVMNKLNNIFSGKSMNAGFDDIDDDGEDDDNTIGSSNPSDWYFGVYSDDDKENPSTICLSEDGYGLDDRLGSHNIPKEIKRALKRAGIFSSSEIMEAYWEVNDYESKTKEEIIESMKNEGFKYSSSLS